MRYKQPDFLFVNLTFFL